MTERCRRLAITDARRRPRKQLIEPTDEVVFDRLLDLVIALVATVAPGQDLVFADAPAGRGAGHNRHHLDVATAGGRVVERVLGVFQAGAGDVAGRNLGRLGRVVAVHLVDVEAVVLPVVGGAHAVVANIALDAQKRNVERRRHLRLTRAGQPLARQVFRPHEVNQRALVVGIRQHHIGVHLADRLFVARGNLHPDRPPVFDQDLFDGVAKADAATERLDARRQAVGDDLTAAFGIKRAAKVVRRQPQVQKRADLTRRQPIVAV